VCSVLPQLNSRFDKKYIIFRHAENFQKCFSQRTIFVKENEASFGIFWHMLFVEMESSKLNYYLAETW
jgi:hypothetical protein